MGSAQHLRRGMDPVGYGRFAACGTSPPTAPALRRHRCARRSVLLARAHANICSHDEKGRPVHAVPAIAGRRQHADHPCRGRVASADRGRRGRRDPARDRATGAGELRASGAPLACEVLRGAKLQPRPARCGPGSCGTGRAADPEPGRVRCASGGVRARGTQGRGARVRKLIGALQGDAVMRTRARAAQG
jgi:hypothetical protein